jgi:hypothetical protein
MNTHATERRYPAAQRNEHQHIDLTRRLPSLKSSLTPDTDHPAARLRTQPIPIPQQPPSNFLPALLTTLLLLAAIAALILAHFPS